MQINNHTQISNDFIENYMNIVSGSSVKVFITICRKTIGWHKVTDFISLSQIMELTGLSNKGVINAIEELKKHNLIEVKRTKNCNKYTVKYLQSEESSLAECKKFTSQSEESSHTKDTYLKKTHKKKYIYILEAWNSKKIQVHNEQTFNTNLKDKHKRILKCYTQEQILKAIDNYCEVVSNDKYYFNWKFTLWDFISRKLEYFIDEADPFTNFLDFKNKKEKPTGKIITEFEEVNW